MSNIAFLGLGAMGSRMSANLLKAGHRLTVWNRTCRATKGLAAKGAVVAATPREAVTGAEIVISMLTDDHASRHTWLHPHDGAVAGLSPKAIAVESSTVTPAWINELHQATTQKEVQLLDAPVVGSRPQAETAQLIFLVGGDEHTLMQAKPILQAMGSIVHHVGGLQTGALLKLAVNSLFAVQVAAVSELLALVARWGMDSKRAWEITSTLPVASAAASGAARLILNGEFSPLFPVSLVEKDLRYALQAAELSQTKVPVVETAQELYRRALDAGYGQENLVAVSKLY